MRRLLRRETFIALRARRLGHQIASEISNPRLDIPEFQNEIRSLDRVEMERLYRQARRLEEAENGPTSPWVRGIASAILYLIGCSFLALGILAIFAHFSGQN
jgi:hypothetical protein